MALIHKQDIPNLFGEDIGRIEHWRDDYQGLPFAQEHGLSVVALKLAVREHHVPETFNLLQAFALSLPDVEESVMDDVEVPQVVPDDEEGRYELLVRLLRWFALDSRYAEDKDTITQAAAIVESALLEL